MPVKTTFISESIKIAVYYIKAKYHFIRNLNLVMTETTINSYKQKHDEGLWNFLLKSFVI